MKPHSFYLLGITIICLALSFFGIGLGIFWGLVGGGALGLFVTRNENIYSKGGTQKIKK